VHAPEPRRDPLQESAGEVYAFPLSFAQRRLWFLDQLEPGNPSYNIAAAVRLEGFLDVPALSAALREIERRHETLRTTFAVLDDQPVQVVSPAVDLEVPILDLRALGTACTEAWVLASEAARQPFDLTRGPLWRARLVRVANDEHLLLLSLHHIVADGWSVGVLIHEAATLYAAFASGQPSPLPELPIQYADFVLWQQEWLQSEALEIQLRYWTERLSGAPPLLELPSDRPRSGAPARGGGLCQTVLPADLIAALQARSGVEGATLFMLLLATFQALLGRYCGQDDIVVGSPIANRSRREIEGLIGLFVNTLALRCPLSGNPDFRMLVARVREVTLGAYANQDLPFEKLVEELAPERSLAHTPLFQVLLVLQGPDETMPELPGLSVEVIELPNGLAKFDLLVDLKPDSGGLSVRWTYDRQIFDGPTAERMLGHFQSLLEAVVADPQRRISQLPLLSVAERHQILLEWNASTAGAAGQCLHELFAEQAARRPGATALIDGVTEISYGELRSWSTRLARRLRTLGVGPETRVGVLLERSWHLVATLLGVLEAGGAYVGLDPAYPRERLELLLVDSGARILLTRESLRENLPVELPGLAILCCERLWAELAAEEPAPLPPVAGPESLAYLIYTSGSTGRPKAVAIEHRSAVALVEWSRQVFTDRELEGVLASTSIGFDLSAFELFVPLCRGGTVVLATNVLELPRLPAAARVRLINTVPSAMAELVRAGGVPSGVETVCLAGEALRPALAAEIHRLSPTRRVLNLYGPSEDTTYSIWAEVPLRSQVVPIGRPVCGTRAHVLDQEGELLPIGVPGELLLAGAGLARCYLGRPELTAERFVPDPFSGEPGARAYRTGDLVRHYPGGDLEFLGRTDHQVKVRGFRVEPGEIEAALEQHARVREAAVVSLGEGASRHLVAYVAPAVEAGDLRSFLRDRLPDYLVPAVFVRLEALPRTPNGKVDRRALSAPESTREPEQGFVAPRTWVEELIVGVWEEVLGVEPVGREDNFFALGGHSLLATQVVSHLRRALPIDLSLRALFENPTPARLAAHAETAQRGPAAPLAPPLVPVPHTTDVPLSHAQQRLWFLEKLAPGSPLYHLPGAFRLTGPLSFPVLARSLAEVVRRHEILRTTFPSLDGRPVQRIAPSGSSGLPMIDLCGLPAQLRSAELELLRHVEARRPFDVAQGPLLRACVLRSGGNEHTVVVTMHHIVSDGWSLGVLVREVAELYRAFSQGEGSPLPELPIQYADFAHWQRQWLQGEEISRQLAYWRRQLAGAPELLDLPTDRPRPAVQGFHGQRLPVEFPDALVCDLEALSRRRGVTLFMTLLGSLIVLFQRYTHREDLAVGSPIANRTRPELENLIGFFVNTVVLRVDASGEPSFCELLGRVREVALEAQVHQDLPFDRLVEELQPTRSLSYTPLFQVVLALQNAPASRLELPDLVIEPLEIDNGTAKFDLTLILSQRNRSLRGDLEYNAELFDRETIQRLQSHLKTLLEELSANPEARIGSVPMLREPERLALVSRGTQRALCLVEAPLHRLFEERAAAAPEAIAVTCEGTWLTYGQLNARANRLARLLRSCGVRPEVPVGILLERSVELVVAILGILKAGGAYVPLDPAYPPERLSLLIKDAVIPVLVTQGEVADHLPVTAGRVIDLDAERQTLTGYNSQNLSENAFPGNAAYVIHTSGSTGHPKGVVVTHANVVRLFAATSDWYDFGPDDVWTLFHSYAFDFSVWEIWGALLFGGRLVVVPYWVSRSPEDFYRLVSRERVTVLSQTPSAFGQLMRAEESVGVAPDLSLRWVVFGGEALNVQSLQPWWLRHPDSAPRLVNMYGITETTVHVTYRALAHSDLKSASGSWIGESIPDLSLHVLNRNLDLLPLGVPGELLVGGEGLARGYFGRPELTAERFVPDPFSARPGGRLYRTGDLVRRHTNGELEYLGRIDRQVKIRGFRIELGEIESWLATHPVIREAVVLARGKGDERRLAAYIVPAAAWSHVAPPDWRELASHLRKRLPDYMVPADWVFLDQMPLTPHGKIDFRALEQTRSEGERADSVGPRTPVEELLVGVWTDLLGVDRVGIHDDFFELGGHSLLATQVTSRIRQVLGVELPLQAVFELTTPAQLAGRVEAALRGLVTRGLPPLVPILRDGEIPLSFSQERLWLLSQLEADGSAYNIFGALSWRGPLDTPILERCFGEVIGRHESLRTTFVAVQGRPMQRVAPAGPWTLPVVDLGAVPKGMGQREARALAGREMRWAFDLARGPLFRAALLRLGAEDYILLLNLHHIISDGWSLGVLVREVTTLYRAFSASAPSPLLPLPVQYVDFAAWQRQWLQGEILEEQLAYWKAQLGTGSSVLRIPTDRPRPTVQTFRGGHRTWTLPRELSTSVRHLENGSTPFMVLLATWCALLHRWSGQTDLTVGTFVANRNRTETEGLIGFFVNNLALRVDVRPASGFDRLLARVREVSLAAFSHQDLPFEKLLAEIRPERALDHTPLFQVMFVLQDAPLHAADLPGVQVRRLDVETGRSNFDLTLWIDQGESSRATLEYNAHLFDAATADRLLGHWRNLLESAVSGPQRAVTSLSLLSAAEWHQVTVDWNDTATVWPDAPAGVHSLFELQAALAPEATAVVFGNELLTYGQLDVRADRLADALRALGVGPEVVVGLCLERSPDTLVGLLGILKAGGAYLPLDPIYPRDRIAFLLEDAGVGVVVTVERLAELLPAQRVRIFRLDTDLARPATDLSVAPPTTPAPDHLAYVLYTSGSTGRPKGVLVEHRSLLNYTLAAARKHALGPGDRVLQFASINFDASAEEIYPCLACGATLVLRDDAMLADASTFLDTCGRWGITILDLPTAYWHELVGALGQGARFPASVRLVILGGEKALPGRVAQWHRHADPAVRLINTYGPTEATIVTTGCDLTDAGSAGREVSIGRPVENVRTYVLDPGGEPVPVGIPGELLLGGAGLARGYLGRPELTARSFGPDPFSGVPGERLYRTGDLVRRWPNGDLEFLGRLDQQVKIRGYRIELGEIEALLRQHPRVADGVVGVREGERGEMRLVAYLVGAAGERPDPSEIRGHLRQQLPEYMVPAAFVLLDALPLTLHGKVDRAALPAPAAGDAPADGPFEAPQTLTEELLSAIWGQVLGIELIGRHDGFFDLGGYSLLATQVIARVRETFAAEISLVTVFEAPTLAGMAARIDEASRTPLPPIVGVPRDQDLPTSFSQERVWFLSQLDPHLTAYHVPRALRLTGTVDIATLELAYGALVKRHEILRTAFPTVDGRPVQRIGPPGPFHLRMIDLGGLAAEAREREMRQLVLTLGRQTFDLTQGPLLRVTLLRLDHLEHVLIQVEHHLIHDGWAEGVLLRDLLGFYKAFREGRAPDLPELPIQFADFAVWQRQWLQGDLLETQIAYWKEHLAGAPALLDLPVDRPRPAIQGSRGAQEELRIPADVIEPLQDLVRRNGVTLFMAMLAAFKVVLHRYSGQTDIVVGTGIANRRRHETEGLLGMVINTVPLRTRLDEGMTFRELLLRVREVCLGAYAHQDLPFEKLVEALRPERSLSHTPIFQVMFAFHDAPHPRVDLPDLTLSALEAHNRSSKFDLLIIVVPVAPNRARDGEAEAATATALFEYDTDLFDAPTIRRMEEHFATVLRAVAHGEDRPIRELPLISAAERHHLLAELNATDRPHPAGLCLHQLFAAQAARTPDATALIDGSERLSYGELNRRANRLAHRLRELGAGPEARLGVCLDRSPLLVISLLAVLKAGASYVPLDPAYPRERQALTLEDAGARLVLTSRRLREKLPKTAASILCLDTEDSDGTARSEEDPAPAAEPGNLAYVIYTSGSTGRPKGVAIEHRSAVALVLWALEVFPPEDLTGVLASTSVCFDLSIFELFVPLSAGGAVILAENILHLPSLSAADEVVLINTVPAGLTELLHLQALPPSVRTVNLAGEPLQRSLVARLHEQPAVRRVLNLYGPSEDTTYSTFAQVEPDDPTPPIGRPITNSRVYLVDHQGEPVPFGIPGEIVLGGAGLARGYLDRPDLTAERFVPDPFGGDPGARLYRTGDLARWRASGELEFLGRADQQVKVRGFRIELGEVESLLLRHPAVRQSAVVVHRGPANDPRLVAYVVPNRDVAVEPAALVAELRRHLQELLPAPMIPGQFVPLEQLPLTPSGKIDRQALPAPHTVHTSVGGERQAPRSELERRIASVWQRLLGVEAVGLRDNFFDLGAHSLLMVRAYNELRDVLGSRLQLIDLFRYPTIQSLVEFIEPAADEPPRLERSRKRIAARLASSSRIDRSVAIIGMQGRFPKAADLEQFWRNLRDGVEAVSFFSEEEMLARGVDLKRLRDPAYVRATAALEDSEWFDAAFFGFSPREAEIMDPQHRLFLECAWEAMEDAGYDPEQQSGAIGVFAGVSMNRYWLNLSANPELMATQGGFPVLLGNDKDFLATRVSYKLNLRGPSINVQTACSTSLVAVHLACQSLLGGECDMALAGGVSVNARQGLGYLYTGEGIASPDGHCRAFDVDAQGTLSGNGLGIVVLKRLEDALAEGDSVRAIIRGSAINNDGSLKVSYMAPSVEGQANVIAEALSLAGVDPASVTCVEAHGTGTELGDLIEISALTEAFRLSTRNCGFCAIGSVKTNIGHLDAASGIAGLIKTVLSLQHGEVPPSLNLRQPNPRIDFANSPFYVNTQLASWPASDMPRRAGVSSFGAGGTNAHVVLEEAPAADPSSPAGPWQLLVLSAATASALEACTDQLAAHVATHPEANLADVAWTCQVGRRRLAHRRILVCRDTADAARALRDRDPARCFLNIEERTDRPVTFLFPGLGDQHLDMARGLYETEPTFRAEVDQSCDILTRSLGVDLREILYPERQVAAGEAEGEPRVDLRRLLGRGSVPSEDAARRLDRTLFAQPAVFVIEHALARLWMEWGVKPAAMIGYSLGEYTAACLAGVFSLEDALWLVAERARLIDELPSGAMLAIPLPESEVLPWLRPCLSVAAVNTPQMCVVAGPESAVSELENELAARDIVSRRLRTSHAFHSRLMEPISERLAERVRLLDLKPPRIPYLSNVTGTWITAREATDPRYWARHLCQTVQFADALRELFRESDRLVLEVGPGQALSVLARQHPERHDDQIVLSSLRDEFDPQPDAAALRTTLGRLWLAGARVNWSGYARHERRRRIPLPTYPFERQRFWVEPEVRKTLPARRATGKKADLADWFYTPVWRLAPPPAAPRQHDIGSSVPWLVFLDTGDIGARLVERLRGQGEEVVTVAAGKEANEGADGIFTIDPRQARDYVTLVRRLLRKGRIPRRVVHLWTLTPEAPSSCEDTQFAGFYSLIFLTRALASEGITDPLEITVLSNGLQSVDGREPLHPEKSTLLGALKVIPQEYRHVACRSIDLDTLAPGSRQEEFLLDDLVAELRLPPTEPVMAYRRGCRWMQGIEPLRLTAPRGADRILRQRGVYVITGGLGRLGHTLASSFAESVAARLVLVSRSMSPDREEKIRGLEEQGAEVLAIAADVADRAQMEAAIRAAQQRFGEIHGVLHLAGVIERMMIEETDPIRSQRIFRPKVKALPILEEVVKGLDLDFCVLFSSIATTLGGLGYASYTAANAYADAFVYHHNRGSGIPWMSLGWDGGRGSSERAEENDVGADLAALAMTPGETVEAFHRALSMSAAPQIIVSPGDLAERIDRWVRFAATEAVAQETGGELTPSHSRPSLQTAFVPPGSEDEKAIAHAWQELLGIAQIGIHDNFFELGGDSLLATRLLANLRRVFRLDLSFRTMFEATTVAAQAVVIRRLLSAWVPQASAGLAAIERQSRSILEQLQELDALSEEDLELESLSHGAPLFPAGGERIQ
jgi:amino acid adenylation domain-containing protein